MAFQLQLASKIFNGNIPIVQKLSPHFLRCFSTTNVYQKFTRTTNYEVLGIDQNASQAQIKEAFYELSKKYHPDVLIANDESPRKFIEILEAYDSLRNEKVRQKYNSELAYEAAIARRHCYNPFVYQKHQHKKAKEWLFNYLIKGRKYNWEQTKNDPFDLRLWKLNAYFKFRHPILSAIISGSFFSLIVLCSLAILMHIF